MPRCSKSHPSRRALRLTRLENRITPALATPTTAVGAGAGALPVVNVYDRDGGLMRSFLAYDSSFRGGVRVAVADVTGDGIWDVITAPGPGGGPHVKVFDGVTGALVRQWMAYDPAFRGGVFVAAAPIDLNDNFAEIVTGAGAGGGPHVQVFDGKTGEVVTSFMAYDPAFTGGVDVAAIRTHTVVDPDPRRPSSTYPGQVMTGAGPGGGPHVRFFDGTTGQMQGEFFAWPHNPHGLGYVAGYSGGVNVAADFESAGGDQFLAHRYWGWPGCTTGSASLQRGHPAHAIPRLQRRFSRWGHRRRSPRPDVLRDGAVNHHRDGSRRRAGRPPIADSAGPRL